MDEQCSPLQINPTQCAAGTTPFHFSLLLITSSAGAASSSPTRIVQMERRFLALLRNDRKAPLPPLTSEGDHEVMEGENFIQSVGDTDYILLRRYKV